MKKVIIGIFSLFLLVSCGDSVKTYSKEEKQKMIELSTQNNKSKQELENILKDLKEKVIGTMTSQILRATTKFVAQQQLGQQLGSLG
ncbi:MAG: hypothetical protein RSC71_05380, partial [Cetobacterium sp.]